MARKRCISGLARLSLVSGLGLVVIGISWLQLQQWPQPTGTGLYNGNPARLSADYAKLTADVAGFEQQQSSAGFTVENAAQTHKQLSVIALLATSGQYIEAEKQIKSMRGHLTDWQHQLAVGLPTPEPSLAAAPTPDLVAGLTIPILIYHYTPADFDAQLTYLDTHGYVVIGLDAVTSALAKRTQLPAKAAVITFDDGFENQMEAFHILQQHHMKATFYIINGGSASNWCIGAGRKYNDPAQPAGGCGDSYLTWDQVRQLDQSGLITIGGHTLDHPQLPTLSAESQRHEIVDSKAGIEAEIGHPIHDFAYPYGSYDQTTVNLVIAAGYRSAVTTVPSDFQSYNSAYTLSRIRTTFQLP